MKEAVPLYVEPFHVYWESASECTVTQLVRIVVRISEQLLHVREWTNVRVHNDNQRFRLVGCMKPVYNT